MSELNFGETLPREEPTPEERVDELTIKRDRLELKIGQIEKANGGSDRALLDALRKQRDAYVEEREELLLKLRERWRH